MLARLRPALFALAFILTGVTAFAQLPIVDPPPDDEEWIPPSIVATGRLTLRTSFADLAMHVEARNEGERRSGVDFQAFLPGAVGTRLAVYEPGAKRWLEGRSWPADAADRRFRELAGPGFGRRDPGLMYQWWPGALGVAVVPVLPGETRVFEFELRLPTTYRDGIHWVALGGLEPFALTLVAAESGARIVSDGRELASGTVIETHEGQEVGLRFRSSAPVVGRLAEVSLPGRAFDRFELDVSPDPMPIPSEAAIVVAIDRSRSMGSAGFRAAERAARAFLSYFPEARVRVLFFARGTAWAESEFVPAAAALADLVKPRPLDNGSAVDRALVDSVVALRSVPGAKRIALFTDGRTAERLRPETLERAVSDAGAILHLGIVRNGPFTHVSRNDTHAWTGAARRTGGLVWDVTVTSDREADEQARSLFEQWAHPLRLEHVRLRSGSLDFAALPETLERGAGIEVGQFRSGSVGRVVVTAELWSKRVALGFAPDPADSQVWSELLLGSPYASELRPEEDTALALRTNSVSATRSFFAVEDAATPTGTGNDYVSVGDPNAPFGRWLELEGGGWGLACDGCWYDEVASKVAGGLELLTPAEQERAGRRTTARTKELLRRVRTLLAECGGDAPNGVAIETNLGEIVDVRPHGGVKALGACLEDGIWRTELSSVFDEPRTVVELDLGRSG